ncbi:hypothetical protein GCM10009863_05220 [Streptomyces axinellae]|uniref:Uncharacterized protein n=1 Tax=Streptomyces axinellae TaxID=552788 RepID=A0ABN3PNK1_9ACTN
MVDKLRRVRRQQEIDGVTFTMPDTQTDAPSAQQTAGEGDHRGKHRGAAAAAEEQRQTVPSQGRHRRPAQ